MHWIRNVESLSQQMMVVIPDLPGSGDSASPQPPFSAESIAAMLLQGLDEIIGAQTQFSIGGFSMGGLIAGYLAQQGKSRVDALVLVGSTGMTLFGFNTTGVNPIGVIVSLGTLLPGLAVSVRRLHDIDRVGWWVLLALIPVIGAIVLIYWACLRGTVGANRFGPDPLAGKV